MLAACLLEYGFKSKDLNPHERAIYDMKVKGTCLCGHSDGLIAARQAVGPVRRAGSLGRERVQKCGHMRTGNLQRALIPRHVDQRPSPLQQRTADGLQISLHTAHDTSAPRVLLHAWCSASMRSLCSSVRLCVLELQGLECSVGAASDLDRVPVRVYSWHQGTDVVQVGQPAHGL